MSNIYKSILSISAAAMVAGVTLIPADVLAWGDSNNGRASYTIAEINEGKLGDTITFNSISDGKIGNEKNFVGAKVAGTKADTWNADTINVKDGETYTIRLYVHNNSPKGEEAVAENVRANFSLPTKVAKSHTIIGYINSSNANPGTYWDEVTLNSDSDFYLEYVDGSAKYTNAKMGTVSLPNELITSGATLGYDSLNGKIPGCYEYDGVVTIDVKVHNSVAAKLQKFVRLKGTKEWGEVVEAKVGDEVEYRIEYKNMLAEDVNDVMIRDILPNNVEYVPNSTYFFKQGLSDWVLIDQNTLTTTGINVGSYKPGGDAYVRFTGKVVDKSLSCGSNQLVNWANVTVRDSEVYKDDASVMVTKDDETCKAEPEVVVTTSTTTPKVDTAETPKTIVNTGAGTIVTGAIGAGSVVTTLGYYLASRKKLM